MIWKDINLKKKKLMTPLHTEVLVIGGGMCGMLTAYQLTKAQKQVVLITANEIGDGRTKRSTAVVTALQDLSYSQLAKKNEAKAKLFLKANLEAVQAYKNLKKELDFELETVSSYKYTIHEDQRLKKEFEWLRKNHASVQFHEQDHALELKEQAQMDPISLLLALSKHLTIYEHTRVLKIEGNTAYTAHTKIEAEHIVIATGYPFLRWKGGFFYKLAQNKSYVVAVKQKSKMNPFNAIQLYDDAYYFRTFKDYLLIGSGNDRVGSKKNGFKKLEEYCKNSHFKMVKQWQNQDTKTLDKLPYIGRYKGKHNWYVATGFEMWGMTGSMISAHLLTDLIIGKKNTYDTLFDPYRPIVFTSFMTQLWHSAKGLLSPSVKRCPHLGCALHWNEASNRFECGCHGSTFTSEGKILDSPSNKDVHCKK